MFPGAEVCTVFHYWCYIPSMLIKTPTQSLWDNQDFNCVSVNSILCDYTESEEHKTLVLCYFDQWILLRCYNFSDTIINNGLTEGSRAPVLSMQARGHKTRGKEADHVLFCELNECILTLRPPRSGSKKRLPILEIKSTYIEKSLLRSFCENF